ncbi:hypothetical protein C8R44DRAFT_649127 [Mycena epipterygia]|nr:hypothetical protein C8R44DRAFT_649127 [Mycena epipterygia]
MLQRFKTALEQLDAILPREYRWENSRRLGYSYLVCVYTWYYRMGEQGHGAPPETHPNHIHKGVKINFHQRIPYSTVDTIQKTMEYESLVEIFGEVMEFQRVQMQRLNLEAYEQVRIFADVLPLNTSSPAYPFCGFMLNLRVATNAHKDPKDKKWCEIIFVSDCEGGHLCLHELGIKLDGRTGHILIFPSCYITHFNTHFEGLRASLVLHTDREGDKWADNAGGWGDHITRHEAGYMRE